LHIASQRPHCGAQVDWPLSIKHSSKIGDQAQYQSIKWEFFAVELNVFEAARARVSVSRETARRRTNSRILWIQPFIPVRPRPSAVWRSTPYLALSSIAITRSTSGFPSLHPRFSFVPLPADCPSLASSAPAYFSTQRKSEHGSPSSPPASLLDALLLRMTIPDGRQPVSSILPAVSQSPATGATHTVPKSRLCASRPAVHRRQPPAQLPREQRSLNK
jgi:hypothetical protein